MDRRRSKSETTIGAPDLEASVQHKAGGLVGADASSVGHVSDVQVGRDQLSWTLPPHETYEGRHRWDPAATWTAEEERRVVRKTDLILLSWLCIMFFGLQLDRGNLSNALADGLLDDLGITSDDYNNGTTIQLVVFLIAEFPVQLLTKRLGFRYVLPAMMVCWSTVSWAQAWIHDRTSFYITRALIGAFEGGFIPGAILFATYFYTSKELSVRLAAFWSTLNVARVISALLAAGILEMRGTLGHTGWFWLFLIEGILTTIIGLVSFAYLPSSPTSTKGLLWRQPWYTEREEVIMTNRILRDDPSKGDMHNRQAVDWKGFWYALNDYHMWPIYLCGLSWLMPSHPMAQYLTLILRDTAGFGTFQTNLLTIPAYVLFIATAIFFPWLSEKLNERFLLATISQIWVLPCLIALEVLPKSRSPWATYALSILIFAEPYFHPMIVAITSRNAGSVRTRTVASALYNMHVQASNIISSNIYRTEDEPFYFTGNKVLIAIACYNIVLFIGIKIFYVKVNQRREKKWQAMSKEEREHYLTTTTDKGNKRLDFRFAH